MYISGHSSSAMAHRERGLVDTKGYFCGSCALAFERSRDRDSYCGLNPSSAQSAHVNNESESKQSRKCSREQYYFPFYCELCIFENEMKQWRSDFNQGFREVQQVCRSHMLQIQQAEEGISREQRLSNQLIHTVTAVTLDDHMFEQLKQRLYALLNIDITCTMESGNNRPARRSRDTAVDNTDSHVHTEGLTISEIYR